MWLLGWWSELSFFGAIGRLPPLCNGCGGGGGGGSLRTLAQLSETLCWWMRVRSPGGVVGNAAVFTLHFLQGSTVSAAGVIYSGSCHRLSPHEGDPSTPQRTQFTKCSVCSLKTMKNTQKRNEKKILLLSWEHKNAISKWSLEILIAESQLFFCTLHFMFFGDGSLQAMRCLNGMEEPCTGGCARWSLIFCEMISKNPI